ncbi:hypothetical protein [Roseomonas xinghualingensis]|uniref:hypothetical protein n=1 Tax=Roseomonas xinghualingensis TaxID=2986475 RepID=UPI0021F1D07B|nr:hypothetical protein [Roseomonas sp. SXEYE001]MCV4209884.1 hypothetical protein [Roseomonas sp. SXEYE001]
MKPPAPKLPVAPSVTSSDDIARYTPLWLPILLAWIWGVAAGAALVRWRLGAW